MPQTLWTIHDVSDYLAVPVGTLYQWRTRNYGPPALKIGKHLRYKATEVEAWLETMTTKTA